MKAGTTELLKFIKLQRRLGESRRGIIGLLEGLWLATAKNCPSGNIGKFTDEEIAIIVDWDGDPGELVQCLVECGWLDECDQHRLIVHDWNEHCPQYVKGNLKKHGRELITQPAKEPAKEPAKDSATKPSLTNSNQANSNQEDSSVVDEPQTEPPPLLVFECNGPVREWKLSGKQVSEWADAYEGMDILAECKKAKVWLAANGKKTSKGMGRFLVSWLNKAANVRKTPITEPIRRLPTAEERAKWRP